ncbi:UDP-N-acetylmuramoyl-tripeptide--D-alanyl-D-alanine ligase [Penaeicola halotolerans]|uniref:UDP-N-acetylmuramoyl-tripeptide--D-alanyl-D- alanine ligase n=1 Tax=Penaeicola halotolerans TaxID=2793196 RepID=UPI001CF90CD9|nr:UDP-N-acetylmuramoyl-tripeptide--D-alanyl-D-alanine ligase [Penaeicola halotolerans]
MEKLYDLFLRSTGVNTDTRKITEGNLFFALKGPNFNANQLAEEAIAKGAIAAVIDDASFQKDGRYFLVEDVLQSLQALARHHRRQFNIPILALTGSNGKTTSKELINAVLSKKYKTLATQGNLNNHIGVPLTLLQLREGVEFAIIEMGANKQGDIKELVEIAEPDFGLITNVGKAHIEGFGSEEGVRKGKGEMYDYIAKHGQNIFLNTTNQHLVKMAADRGFEIPITYPAADDFAPCTYVEAEPYVSIESADGEVVQTNMLGGYNFENIALALCIGKYFDVLASDALAAVRDYVPANMRSQLIQKRTNTIILDAYNANPTSMKAAIENFAAMKVSPKVIILGDMYELGETEVEEHLKIGTLLKDSGIDKIILTGDKIKAAIPEIPRALYFPDPFSLRVWLGDSKWEGQHILIKGSRSMGLEKLVDFI